MRPVKSSQGGLTFLRPTARIGVAGSTGVVVLAVTPIGWEPPVVSEINQIIKGAARQLSPVAINLSRAASLVLADQLNERGRLSLRRPGAPVRGKICGPSFEQRREGKSSPLAINLLSCNVGQGHCRDDLIVALHVKLVRRDHHRRRNGLLRWACLGR